MLDRLDAEQAKCMMLYVADAVMQSKDYLTATDSAIGDGDHGIGMSNGFQRVKESLTSENAVTDLMSVFKMTGRAMLFTMGGASGVLFGSLFEGGAKALTNKDTLDGEAFATMLRAGLDAVKIRGKAEIGDKTMVDALEPAVKAIEASASKELYQLLEIAEAAARQGLEDTKGYVARFGRATFLQERSLGFQDAGATSVYIIIKGMNDYVKGLVKE
jgi:dihydroxyacetone kinase phosphoprotein-dependent L subunit